MSALRSVQSPEEKMKYNAQDKKRKAVAKVVQTPEEKTSCTAGELQ